MPKEKEYQYNPKRRKLAKIYSKQKLIMSIGNKIILPLIAITVLFSLGIFQKLADWSLSKGPILGVVLFVLLITIILLIFEFPVSFYGEFIYEHKYHLSKQSFGKWLIDYFKETLIELIFAVPVSSITAFLAMNSKLWWIYAAAFSVLVSLFVNFVYPVVILPFLHKLEPYKNKEELRKIFEIIRRCGASKIKTVRIQRESEKSTKVNAFFAGIGKTTSIVLYDNLINMFTKKEVRTVIGHELGHYVNKDIIRFETFGAIQAILSLFITDFILRKYFMQNVSSNIPLSLIPVISAILIIIGFLTMPIVMAYSRRRERLADLFALDHVKEPIAQISTDRRLNDLDLGDENPHPLIEFWFYSHPCAEKRIKYTREWMRLNVR